MHSSSANDESLEMQCYTLESKLIINQPINKYVLSIYYVFSYIQNVRLAGVMEIEQYKTRLLLCSPRAEIG